MKKSSFQRLLSAVLAVTVSAAMGYSGLSFVPLADASALTALSDTMSSVKISAASSNAIRFTATHAINVAGDTIVVTFPSDFNFTGKTIGSVTFTHDASAGTGNSETLAASPSASAWGAVFSGTQNRVLTLTAPTDGTGAASLDAAQKVIITYDSTAAVNPTVAGNYSIAVSTTGSNTDSGSITVPILNDDQVVITATVSQTLTFSISDNTIGFGALSAGGARYATGDTSGNGSETEAHQLSVATNAASGYTMTVQGATLTYGAATIDAIGGTNAASSAGTEQFGLRLTASGGSGAVSAPYAASGFAYAADAVTSDEVAASTAASAATTYSARYLANIATSTEAGAYQATLTYVTTANF